ncbi:MAG: hypothetical protein WD847_21450 [Pirellulales bacterium]
MKRVKGYRLYVELNAAKVRRRLRGHGFGVRKVESAGSNRAVIIHTATGDHLRELEVWLVGLWLCVRRRRQYPGPATLAGIAVAIVILERLVDASFSLWHTFLLDRGWTQQQAAMLHGVLSLVRAVFEAVAWAMVLVAVFGWRQAAEPRPAADVAG